jgi:hypothetical protein
MPGRGEKTGGLRKKAGVECKVPVPAQQKKWKILKGTDSSVADSFVEVKEL